MEQISVIIPVLNEAANLGAAIASIPNHSNTEIIVVDGGSQDQTPEIAKSLGATVVNSPPGRALQMNAGAKIAQGDILLFLHGDSRLPDNFEALIYQALTEKPKIIAGAFALHIDAPQTPLRWIEWGVEIRSRWGQMPYGDQGIFLRAEMFQSIGGFPELPIMEDFELMRRLQKRGAIAFIPAPIKTSARRWLQKGIWQTTLINQLIVCGYLSGLDPQLLRRFYRHQKSSS